MISAAINQRGNQVVSGVAINMLAAGLAVVLGNQWFREGGRTPALPPGGRFLPIDIPGLSAWHGVPIIGRIPQVSGAYVASGHSCWGILNSPATGLAVAELLLDGKATCLDLAPFDPARFDGITW
jgi:ABC-type uncharacterized transport system permease subunit